MAFNCLNFLKVHLFQKFWFQMSTCTPYTAVGEPGEVWDDAKERRVGMGNRGLL